MPVLTESSLWSAEGRLTTAVLTSPACYDEVRWLDADLFTDQAVKTVYLYCVWVRTNHPHLLNPDDFAAYVRDVMIEYRKGEALKDLAQMIAQPSGLGINASRYAVEIFEAKQREDLVSVARGMLQVASEEGADFRTMKERFDLMLGEFSDTLGAEPGYGPVDGLSGVEDFMAADEQTYEWVIPGLLERQERLMAIAPEKAGKTTLTRQVTLMLASGRHPLRASYGVPPMRSLLVDLENPEPVIRRDYRRQISAMRDLWASDNGNAYIWHRPAGIHLGDPHDRLALRRAMEHVRPDLLCVSPVYKAFDGLEKGWEEQAHGVQKPLDLLRQEFDCAIWLEHHPPGRESGRAHREIRPFGSTRWGRWLDYQVALVPPQDVDRPPYRELWWNSVRRDERKMTPLRIRRGIGAEASWVPEWADGDMGFHLAMSEFDRSE